MWGSTGTANDSAAATRPRGGAPARIAARGRGPAAWIAALGITAVCGGAPFAVRAAVPDAAAPRGPQPVGGWWDGVRTGRGWRAAPHRGGTLLTWDPSAAPVLRLPWPPLPGGLEPPLVGYRLLGGRADLFDPGPGEWSLAGERFLLLRRENDRLAAMVGFPDGEQGAVWSWDRPAPDDPSRHEPAVLVLAAGEARGPVRVWCAAAAPADTLWARWRAVSGPGPVPRDGPPAIRLRPGQAPWPPSLREAALHGMGLDAVVVDAADPGSGEGLVALGRVLKAGGRRLGLVVHPFSASREEARRLPFSSVRRRGRGGPPFPLRGTREGVRIVTGRAREDAGRAAFLILEGQRPPGDRLVLAYRAAAGDTPVLVENRPREGGGGAPPPGGSGRGGPDGPDLEGLLLDAAFGVVAPFSTRLGAAPRGEEPGNERRLRGMVAAVSGSGFLVEFANTPPGEEELAALEPLLPPRARAAPRDRFGTAPGSRPAPTHFSWTAKDGRSVHVFFNLGPQREHRMVRFSAPEGSAGEGADMLLYNAGEGTVRGVFPPLAPAGLFLAPRDATVFVAVPDRPHPYLVATGAHWSEGIEELRSSRWDPDTGTLHLVLNRAAGARGTLAVACDAPPAEVAVRGGSAGRRTFEGRGAHPVVHVPVSWDADTLSVRLRFDPVR